MSLDNNVRVKLLLPAKLEFLRPLHHFIAELLNEAHPSCDRKIKDHILLVIHEAFTNVVQHAYVENAEETNQVAVEISIEESQLTMVFSDNGITFIESAWKKPDLDQMQESGRGIWLIKELVDSYCYTTLPDGTNTLTLVKYVK